MPLWRLLTDPVPAGLDAPDALRRRASGRRCATRRSTRSRSRAAGDAPSRRRCRCSRSSDAPPIVRAARSTRRCSCRGRRRGARRPRGARRARRRPRRALLGHVRRRPDGAAPRGRRDPTRCSWSPTRTASGPALGRDPRQRTAPPSAPARRRSPTTRATRGSTLFPDARTDARRSSVAPAPKVHAPRAYRQQDHLLARDRAAHARSTATSTPRGRWATTARSTASGSASTSTTPITTDQVNLVQPLVGPGTGTSPKVDAHVRRRGPRDRRRSTTRRARPTGQTVDVPGAAPSDRLEVTIDDTNVGDTFDYPASNNVGFAEIRLRDDAPGATDVRVDEVVRMPTDLVDAAAADSRRRPLVVLDEPLAQRGDPAALLPGRGGAGAAVPRARRPRDFALGGHACGSPPRARRRARPRCWASAGAEDGGVTVRASQHLPGDVAARGVVRVRRRPGDRVEHRLRRPGRAVGRGADAASR